MRTYHSRDLGHVGRVPAEADGHDDMIDVQHAVLVAPADGHLPLGLALVLRVGDAAGVHYLCFGPVVDFHGLGVLLEPVSDLRYNINMCLQSLQQERTFIAGVYTGHDAGNLRIDTSD